MNLPFKKSITSWTEPYDITEKLFYIGISFWCHLISKEGIASVLQKSHSLTLWTINPLHGGISISKKAQLLLLHKANDSFDCEIKSILRLTTDQFSFILFADLGPVKSDLLICTGNEVESGSASSTPSTVGRLWRHFP